MPDTIVAQSSAPGQSLAGLVRLSGPDAGEIGACLLESADRDRFSPKTSTVRGAYAVRLKPPLPALAGRALWMPGPGTYTGEDTLELEVPGHPALLARVLRAAEGAGARRAEPGEFSHRAFLSGRITLLEAEGIAAAIAADGAAELAAAEAIRGGRLAADATAERDAIVHLLGLVEAGIDFTDQEDVVAIAPAKLVAGLTKVDAALAKLETVSAASSAGLPRVVLAGPPSAGKSTLFNTLLGRERAVTDASHHTTRDAIEEELRLPGGRRVLLVDSPGGEAAPAADLLLWFGAEGGAPRHAPHLPIEAKADLHPLADANPDATEDVAARTANRLVGPPLRLSAHSGEGLAALLAAIQAAVLAESPDRAQAPSLLARHRAALAETRESLAAAIALCQDDRDALTHPELVAVTLTQGVHALSSLTGEVTPDDLIASVFSTFCVGK